MKNLSFSLLCSFLFASLWKYMGTGMKLARLAALPDEVLDKAAELIPVLSAAVKV